ncbi:MAG: hypothetical protein KatS3mg102_1943 [Planctomycetota bacterium]|nr:MAG: hypothetical protein KatS3mg102_1943 [Planctomycetota bacterium]
MNTPWQADLGEALRDAYLLRIAWGPGGEPAELVLHRMRQLLPPGAPEHEHTLALRLGGVRALALQALAYQPQADRWEPQSADWPELLRQELMVPPVVAGATLGAPPDPFWLQSLGEHGTWIAGEPRTLLAPATPVVLELHAEGVLPAGADARFTVLAAAQVLEFLDARGTVSLQQVLAEHQAWQHAHRAYWRARALDPATALDPRFEWCPPPMPQTEAEPPETPPSTADAR